MYEKSTTSEKVFQFIRVHSYGRRRDSFNQGTCFFKFKRFFIQFNINLVFQWRMLLCIVLQFWTVSRRGEQGSVCCGFYYLYFVYYLLLHFVIIMEGSSQREVKSGKAWYPPDDNYEIIVKITIIIIAWFWWEQLCDNLSHDNKLSRVLVGLSQYRKQCAR